MKNQQLMMPIIITALIAAGVGFFGGMKYTQMRRLTGVQQFTQGGRMMGGNTGGNVRLGTGRAAGFRPVGGEILSADDTSITVKLPDGSSKIVLVSATTTINKAQSAGKTDLAPGQQVAVFGTDNPDGSVTAQTIQLNPLIKMSDTATPSGRNN